MTTMPEATPNDVAKSLPWVESKVAAIMTGRDARKAALIKQFENHGSR